jgi:hypothetical protein
VEGRIKYLCNFTTMLFIDCSRNTTWREQPFEEEDTDNRPTACLVGKHYPLTTKMMFPTIVCHMSTEQGNWIGPQRKQESSSIK